MDNKEKKENDKGYRIITTSNYNSLFFNKEEKKPAPSISNTDLADLLSNPAHKLLKDDVLRELKKEGGKQLLLDAIRETSDPQKLVFLVAACWESGQDMTEEAAVFAEMAMNNEAPVALEALTVIEESVLRKPKADLAKTLERLAQQESKTSAEKKFILTQIRERLMYLNATGNL